MYKHNIGYEKLHSVRERVSHVYSPFSLIVHVSFFHFSINISLELAKPRTLKFAKISKS